MHIRGGNDRPQSYDCVQLSGPVEPSGRASGGLNRCTHRLKLSHVRRPRKPSGRDWVVAYVAVAVVAGKVQQSVESVRAYVSDGCGTDGAGFGLVAFFDLSYTVL